MKKLLLLLVVVVLQILFLIGMGMKWELISQYAPRYYLQTRPKDPYDIFRGNYVYLRYDIEQCPRADTTIPSIDTTALDSFDFPNSFGSYKKNGYIALMPSKDSPEILIAKAYVLEKPEPPFLPASFLKSFNNNRDTEYYTALSINKYFTDKETAKKLELFTFERLKKMLIEIALDDDGTAIITGYKFIE